MAVTCRDICNLEILAELKLLGGEGGLGKEITWPYIKSAETITEWIYGGEIIFVVGRKEELTEESLIRLMKEAIRCSISGIVFLIGGGYLTHVPRSVVRMADEYKIPVFKMPFMLKLIDVTREIIKLLLMDNRVDAAKTTEESQTVLSMLLGGADREKLLCYCYKRLQPLIEADKFLRTEYVFTLRKYIECGNDLLHTAQEIYIHRNTMINRMKKISVLLEENVNDPFVRGDFQNIFQVLEYYGEELICR